MNTATPDDQPEEWNQESLAAYLLSKGVGASKTAAAANLLIEAGYTTETELLAAKEGRLETLGLIRPVLDVLRALQRQQNGKLRCCFCILVLK